MGCNGGMREEYIPPINDKQCIGKIATRTLFTKISQQAYDSDDWRHSYPIRILFVCVARTLGANNFLEKDHVGVFEPL